METAEFARDTDFSGDMVDVPALKYALLTIFSFGAIGCDADWQAEGCKFKSKQWQNKCFTETSL